jgi:hypothetical protein
MIHEGASLFTLSLCPFLPYHFSHCDQTSFGILNPPWLRSTPDFAVPHDCWLFYNISNMGALVSFMTLPYHHIISSTSVTHHCILVLGNAFWGLLTPNNEFFHQFRSPNRRAKPAIKPKVIIERQLNPSFRSFLNEIQLVYLLHFVDDFTTIIVHPNINQPHCSFSSILTYIHGPSPTLSR